MKLFPVNQVEYVEAMVHTSIGPGGTFESSTADAAALPTESTDTGGTKTAPTMGTLASFVVGKSLRAAAKGEPTSPKGIFMLPTAREP